MSVAFVYDSAAINNMLPVLIRSQIESIENQVNDIDNKIQELQSKLEVIANEIDNKSEIERNYAANDIERYNATLARLNNKLNARKQELAEINSGTTNPEI